MLDLLKNNNSLWRPIYFIVFTIYTICNVFLLFLIIAALWKFSTDWSSYPPLFRWMNFILPVLLLLITLLGCIGSFCKSFMCLLMRILIIIFAVFYWFALNPLHQMSTQFKSDIREAWTEQMNGSPQGFNIIEDFLHCCGLKGINDYEKINMTIPGSCEKYSNLNPNGCLLEAVEKFKLEQSDFFAWGQLLWIFIGIDIFLSLLALVVILTDKKLKIRQDRLLHEGHIITADSPLLAQNYYQNLMTINCV